MFIKLNRCLLISNLQSLAKRGQTTSKTKDKSSITFGPPVKRIRIREYRRRMIRLLPHHPPLSRHQVVSLLSLSVCHRPRREGRGWERTQIIRRRESLVLSKLLHTSCGRYGSNQDLKDFFLSDSGCDSDAKRTGCGSVIFKLKRCGTVPVQDPFEKYTLCVPLGTPAAIFVRYGMSILHL
jgi:hypothetical protein